MSINFVDQTDVVNQWLHYTTNVRNKFSHKEICSRIHETVNSANDFYYAYCDNYITFDLHVQTTLIWSKVQQT